MMKAFFLLTLTFLFTTCFGQTYNYYYGNIHAHTGFSDGSKDSSTSGISQPGKAYAYARQSYNFNFLGISEHNHLTAGMHIIDYARGLYQADTANHNGQFVSMYGMEYGVISNGGHVVVYGIDSLVGWENNNYQIYNSEYDYASLWKLIARRPKAFATVAHPSDNDFTNIANSTYIDTADIALVGVPLRSGAAFSTTTNYSDAPPGTVYDVYFQKLLARGYHVGATIDHDNHYTTFGRTAHSRTVALASTLNRDSIMDAYRKMRFYASDDWNVQVNFTINAYPLGSVFNSVTNPSINIQVTDPDAGDNVSTIDLYYGVPGSGALSTVLTSASTGTLSYTHNISLGDRYYYYAVITQADGNKIWTSPIWVTKTSSLPLTLLSFTAKVLSKSVSIDAAYTTDEQYQSISVEKGYKGYDFNPIRTFTGIPINSTGIHMMDNDPREGYQYYRLKLVNRAGGISYSNTVTVAYHNQAYTLTAAGNHNEIVMQVTSPLSAHASINLYNEDGRLVMKKEVHIQAAQNSLKLTANTFHHGLYILVIEFENGIRRECKVII
jgi:hypothetical protein